jgi:hypothetical protein
MGSEKVRENQLRLLPTVMATVILTRSYSPRDHASIFL